MNVKQNGAHELFMNMCICRVTFFRYHVYIIWTEFDFVGCIHACTLKLMTFYHISWV